MDREQRRSSLYDGDASDESRTSSRRTLMAVLVVTALVVAAGVVVLLAANRDSPDDAAAGTVTVEPTEPPPEEASGALIERVTDLGLTLRLRVGDEFEGMGQQNLPADAPAWCEVSGVAFGTIISPEAVAQTQMALSKVAGPDGAGQMMLGGTFEGAPIWGVVVQVPAHVVLVRATQPGSQPDEMVPVDGLAIVALTTKVAEDAPRNVNGGDVNPWGGADLEGAKVEYVSANGQRQSLAVDVQFNGPPMWNDQRCWQVDVVPPENLPPQEPPDLPDPGVQPLNPAVDEAAISSTLTALFSAPIEEGREFFELIDDASGIDINVASALDERVDLDDLLTEGEPEIVSLVFISPIEALFYYNIEAPFGAAFNHLGRARIVDGRWKITRGTFCLEVTQYGVFCGV